MLKVGGDRGYVPYPRPRPARRPSRPWVRVLVRVGLGSLLLLGLPGLIYQGLSRSSLFQVTEIDIEGNGRVTKEQILELSRIDIHTNLLALSGRQVRKLLAGHPWVETAAVERQWPNRLRILVRERVPVAILNRAGQLFYLDRRGLAFAPVLPPDDLDYPVISGGSPEAGVDSADSQGLTEALLFLRYAGAGNPNLPLQNISEINIADADDLVLFLMSRPFPIHLGRGRMKSKYAQLAQVLSGLYRRKAFNEIAYIDVDYRDGQILVGLLGG
jgi:cell division protein FtsQ